MQNLSHSPYDIVLLTYILTPVAVEFVDLLKKSFDAIFVEVDSFDKGNFGLQEGSDVEMNELSIVYELLGSPDLFWFGLFHEVSHGSFEHWGDYVPVLEDRDPGLLVFEGSAHNKNTQYHSSNSGQSLMKNEQNTFHTILAKFILNLPPQELEDNNRLAFQADKAFYYYIDIVINQGQPRDWELART